MILERNNHALGHIHSVQRECSTWDEGPHVSFTKSDYVRQLFAESVEGEFEEYEVKTANYYEVLGGRNRSYAVGEKEGQNEFFGFFVGLI